MVKITEYENNSKPQPKSNIRPGDLPDTFKVTTTSLTPRSRSSTRTVVLPKKKYKGPEFDEVKVNLIKPKILLKDVISKSAAERKTYMNQVRAENQKIQKHNQENFNIITQNKKAIDDWNKKGRFQKQTTTETYYPSTTRYETPGIEIKRITSSTPTTTVVASYNTTKNLTSIPKLETYKLPTDLSLTQKGSFALDKVITRLEDKKYQNTNKPIKDILVGASSSLAILPVSAAKRVLDFTTFLGRVSPQIDTKTGKVVPIKDRPKNIASFKPGEITATSNMSKSEKIYSSFITRPEKATGELLTDFFAPTTLIKASGLAKNTLVKLTSTKLAPESVFDTSVLIGKNKFPLRKTSNLTSRIKDYKKTSEFIDGEKLFPTLHATDSVGRIKQVTFNPIYKNGKLAQDPSLYVAPMGRGSPHFLRVSDELPSFTFDLTNMFKPSSPKLYRIYVKDVKGLPRSVMSGKSYEPVFNFQKTANQEYAYITKGSFLRTKEEEANIIGNTLLKPLDRKAVLSPFKGQSFYTTYKGKTIPILDVRATSSKVSSINDFFNSSKLTSSNLSPSNISKYYSSFTSSSKMPVSPSLFLTSSSSYKPSSSSSAINNSSVSSSSYSVSSSSIPSSSIFSSSSYKPGSPTIDTYNIPESYIDTSSSIISSKSKSGFSDIKLSSLLSYKPASYSMSGILATSSTNKLPKYKNKTRSITTKLTNKTNMEQAFDVFVRSKGNWTKVKTNETMNYYAAKHKGFNIADNYAERSVKLKPTNKKAQKISYSEPYNNYKFTWNKSKKEKLKKSFIEKSKYAIDTIGELKGITYKGIKTKKNNKRSNFL
jgi:hypothetical protein